jgi:hypothetical protein
MSEQVWIAIIQAVVSISSIIAGSVVVWLKAQQTHLIVNSQRTEMVNEISNLKDVIAQIVGPEKARSIELMNRPQGTPLPPLPPLPPKGD